MKKAEELQKRIDQKLDQSRQFQNTSQANRIICKTWVSEHSETMKNIDAAVTLIQGLVADAKG